MAIDVHLQIEVVLGPPETLSSQSPGIAVKAHAEMLLGASPQFVESPWAVAGLSSRDTANGTARGATIDHNVVPCFSSATSFIRSQNQRWKTSNSWVYWLARIEDYNLILSSPQEWPDTALADTMDISSRPDSSLGPLLFRRCTQKTTAPLATVAFARHPGTAARHYGHALGGVGV
jgi:hypothetical protein